MKEHITLRAHHGMCLAFFAGKGYSDAFSAHMWSVLELLQDDPTLRLAVWGDAICERCPNFQGGRCNTPEQVERYDRQVLALCGLAENDQLSWREFSRLVSDRILSQGKRKSVCGDCAWSALCQEKEMRVRV